MPRIRTIRVGAINLAMNPPHSPQGYVNLFSRTYRLRLMASQGQLHWFMLGSLHGVRSNDGSSQITGEIYRFVRLNASDPWFNSQTQEQATEEELAQVAIPSHLLPHLQRIPFNFRPSTHTLYYIAEDRTTRLSPSTSAKMLERLFNDERLGLPPVEVTAIPEHDAVEALLSLPRLSRLQIELKPPNADDADELEREVLEWMEAQNARRLDQALVAKKNATLVPDEKTQALARVASRNGNVTVVAREADGTTYVESTSDRPMLRPARVDEEIETATMVLERVADAESAK